MLLESRINDKTSVLIDCEPSSAVDKGALQAHRAHPDRVVEAAVAICKVAAEELGTGLVVDAVTPPVAMEVTFGIQVDAQALVSVARTPDAGQFRVTLRWSA